MDLKKFTKVVPMLKSAQEIAEKYIQMIDEKGIVFSDSNEKFTTYIEYLNSLIAKEKKYNPDGTFIEKKSFKLTKTDEIELVDAYITLSKGFKSIPETLKYENTSVSIFTEIIDYIFSDLYEVSDVEKAKKYFTHFLLNSKRSALGMDCYDEQMLSLFSKSKGVGKDVFVNQLYKSIGFKDNYHTTSFDSLFNKFNDSALKYTCFACIEDGKYKNLEKQELKSFITSKFITVREKYKSEIQIQKRFQLICTTNTDPSVYYNDEKSERRNATIKFIGRKGSFNAEKLYRLMWMVCPTDYWYQTSEISKEAGNDRNSTDYDDYITLDMFANNTSFNDISNKDVIRQRWSLKKLSYLSVKGVEKYDIRRMLDNTDLFYTHGSGYRLRKDVIDVIEKGVFTDWYEKKFDDDIYKDWEYTEKNIQNDVDRFVRHIEDLISGNNGGGNGKQTQTSNVGFKTNTPIYTVVDNIELENKASICVNSGPFETKTEPSRTIRKSNTDVKEKLKLVVEGECESDRRRSEKNIKSIGNVFLDYDDGTPIKETMRKLEGFEYYLYTTSSHTKEHNKYRVILPLDGEVTVNGELSYYKDAKRRMFEHIDERCQCWFYQPSKSSKVIHVNGEKLKAQKIQALMYDIKTHENEKRALSDLRRAFTCKNTENTENSKENYLRKAADTINSSCEGTRDDTAHKTCFTINEKFGIDAVLRLYEMIDENHRDFVERQIKILKSI